MTRLFFALIQHRWMAHLFHRKRGALRSVLREFGRMRWGVAGYALGVLLALCCSLDAAQAQTVDLKRLEATRTEDAVELSYNIALGLPASVEDALIRGVPLYFVAKTRVMQHRWYWRDKHVSTVQRSWRLAYQPLTRRYRVTLAGLSQNFDSLDQALNSLSRSTGWRVVDGLSGRDDKDYYLEFSFKLDTDQLPGPLHLGIDGESDWNLHIERTAEISALPSP